MRPRKFCGKSIKSGKPICGVLIHDTHGATYIDNLYICEAVDPETIAQIIGYTEDGDEIYERPANMGFYSSRMR